MSDEDKTELGTPFHEPEAQVLEYPFLEKLGKDYPNLANRLQSQIPDWVDGVDKLMGVEGLGNTLLETMDYVSAEDEETYFNEVSSEVSAMLDSNKGDKIYFVGIPGGSGSNNYIYEKIRERIPEEKRDSVSFIPSNGVNYSVHVREAASKSVHYFICDDSANSGRQLQSVLAAFDGYGLQNLQKRFFDRAKDVNVHIRMMRMADPAVQVVDRHQAKAKNTHLHIDNQSPRMPIAKDALDKLGISPDQLSTDAQNAILTSHHGWDGAVVGFFSHKIQDNLPRVMIPGAFKYEGITPLLLDTDVHKPY